MSIVNLYNKELQNNSFQTQQYANNVFQQGLRPHYYVDASYTAVGRVFDKLCVVNEGELTYVNQLGGDGASGVVFPAGDEIYGLFKDTDIVVGAGGLVRAYAAYPVQNAKN